MSPSDHCHAAGLKSLVELSKISGVSTMTLRNWNKNKPVLFGLVIRGAAQVKREEVAA
jgi:hypothetical protein